MICGFESAQLMTCLMGCHMKAFLHSVTQCLGLAPHPGERQLAVKLIYHPGWYRKLVGSFTSKLAVSFFFLQTFERIMQCIDVSICSDMKTKNNYSSRYFLFTRWIR